MRRGVLLIFALALGCAGKASVPTTRLVDDRDAVVYVPTVDARATPPDGWEPEPLKRRPTSTHQVWVSPSRRTAYGIIHFDLPFPVGHELAFWGFLENMKRVDGEARILEKFWDSNLHAIRFVVEGGQYRVRTILLVRGLEGWAIYAGTLRNEPIEQDELKRAEIARESTAIGR